MKIEDFTGLASTSRSSGRTTHRHAQCLSKCYVTSVREGSDDEPVCAAQELVLITEVNVCDGDNTIIDVFLEVEARLFQPLEVCHWADVHFDLR